MEGAIPTGSFRATYYRMFNKASKDSRLSRPYGRFHNVGDGDTTYAGETPQTCERGIKANLKGEFVPEAWQIMSVELTLQRAVDLKERVGQEEIGHQEEADPGSDEAGARSTIGEASQTAGSTGNHQRVRSGSGADERRHLP